MPFLVYTMKNEAKYQDMIRKISSVIQPNEVRFVNANSFRRQIFIDLRGISVLSKGVQNITPGILAKVFDSRFLVDELPLGTEKILPAIDFRLKQAETQNALTL